MLHCVMKCAILVLVLLQQLPRDLIRVDIVRIPSNFHQNLMDLRVEGREVVVLELLAQFCLGHLLCLWALLLLLGIRRNQDLSLLGPHHCLESFFLVYVFLHFIHKLQQVSGSRRARSAIRVPSSHNP
jgi:hypothetical protein